MTVVNERDASRRAHELDKRKLDDLKVCLQAAYSLITAEPNVQVINRDLNAELARLRDGSGRIGMLAFRLRPFIL